MKRRSLLLLAAAIAAPAAAETLADRFDRGLCLGACRGWNWPDSQQIDGRLDVVAVDGGKALRARTAARGSRVPKAALIARPATVGAGGTIRVSFDLMVPQGAPLNSLHLVDIECATCGEGHNPGIRLYLRGGRLRIDRSKIGERHAWTNEAAPQLRHGRWQRIDAAFVVGRDGVGGATVRLDGAVALSARGRTAAQGADGVRADRVQIGITASSNPGPAVAYFDNVTVAIAR